MSERSERPERPRAASSADPMIVGAALAAGHDGQAEVTLDLCYANGAQRSASYSYDAIAAALDAVGVASLDDLVGRPWTILLDPSTELIQETTCWT
ncbi:MAG: hypothetical protein AB7Q42_23185 [Acidimicrobiia bacterium]